MLRATASCAGAMTILLHVGRHLCLPQSCDHSCAQFHHIPVKSATTLYSVQPCRFKHIRACQRWIVCPLQVLELRTKQSWNPASSPGRLQSVVPAFGPCRAQTTVSCAAYQLFDWAQNFSSSDQMVLDGAQSTYRAVLHCAGAAALLQTHGQSQHAGSGRTYRAMKS